MNKRLEAIPKFASERPRKHCSGKRNDSTVYMGWNKAQVAVLPNLKSSTQTISLRLPEHLLDSTKSAANARGVPYQSLIKVWLSNQLVAFTIVRNLARSGRQAFRASSALRGRAPSVALCHSVSHLSEYAAQLLRGTRVLACALPTSSASM